MANQLVALGSAGEVLGTEARPMRKTATEPDRRAGRALQSGDSAVRGPLLGRRLPAGDLRAESRAENARE